MLNIIKPWVVDWFLRSAMVNHGQQLHRSITLLINVANDAFALHRRLVEEGLCQLVIQKPHDGPSQGSSSVDRIVSCAIEKWRDESLALWREYKRRTCWVYWLTRKDVNSFRVNDPCLGVRFGNATLPGGCGFCDRILTNRIKITCFRLETNIYELTTKYSNLIASPWLNHVHCFNHGENPWTIRGWIYGRTSGASFIHHLGLEAVSERQGDSPLLTWAKGAAGCKL